jgi:hypothetical protein
VYQHDNGVAVSSATGTPGDDQFGPKHVVFEQWGETNAFEVWILIHRQSCIGTMRSVSANLEYTVQQDAAA